MARTKTGCSRLTYDPNAAPTAPRAASGPTEVPAASPAPMKAQLVRNRWPLLWSGAVYADCDTIILDDPLAAVDSHVAAALFYKLFAEKLKDKAVLRRLHAIHGLATLFTN